ncbi:MAG: alginate O-acetyltransferase AlgF [Pseudomonadota bacterium]
MSLTEFTSIAALGIILTANTVQAADNELYAAPPPDDAAFLRWIELGQAPEVFGVASLGAEGDVFHPVSASLTDGAEAGVFYTAARAADGAVVVIEEPARADRSKVLLTLLNLTDVPVRLVLAEQNVDVIETTPANDAGARAVNPVAATLTIVTQDNATLGSFDVKLRRGQNVTFVARPDGAALIENRFGPNLEG